MKILKLALISFVIFSLILYLISLLIPSDIRVSRAINIVASKEKVEKRILDTRSWPEWNELVNNKIEITVDSVLPGHIVTTWKTKDREIKSSFVLEEAAGITVVQWYFEFHLEWPWDKFGSLVLDKQFGTPMESSLNKLKKLVENSP
jgi:hypothetical protein